MSFSSRRLLTKIYDLNIPKESNNKKEKEKDLLLFGQKLKTKKNNERKKLFLINKTEKGNNFINSTKLKLDNNNNDNNTNKTIDVNKFPVIPKLNIKNVIIKEDTNKNNLEEIKEENNILLLNYKLLESTSEDSNYKLKDLKNGIGWQSERFCQYPQSIYIQFPKPVLIKKIEIILPEKNIPSIIRFYSYYPKEETNNYLINYKEVEYDLVNLIKTNSNENTNFKSREFRKIYPNVKSIFFKLELDKNYLNLYNLFNQVGLFKLDFYGEYLDYKGNSEVNEIQLNYVKKSKEDNIDLIGLCDKQLKELKKKMKYNIEIEDYMECKEIKFKREKIRLYEKKLQELEEEKTNAIKNEDISRTMAIKNLIDKLKIDILNTMTNSNSSKINNDELILSDRYKSKKKYSKFIEPLSRSVQRKPKIFNLENIDENKISNNNYNHTIDNNNLILNDEPILPKVFNKYNFNTEGSEAIKEIEKGKLEKISKEILDEFSDITNILGEENMQKIFSKQYLWQEEGINILLEKLEEIIKINNKNYKNIITSIFKLCLLIMEDSNPSNNIKIFEIIKKVFNYMKNNKIKIKLEKNITEEIFYEIIKIKII